MPSRIPRFRHARPQCCPRFFPVPAAFPAGCAPARKSPPDSHRYSPLPIAAPGWLTAGRFSFFRCAPRRMGQTAGCPTAAPPPKSGGWERCCFPLPKPPESGWAASGCTQTETPDRRTAADASKRFAPDKSARSASGRKPGPPVFPAGHTARGSPSAVPKSER